jgi:hypothetical protein
MSTLGQIPGKPSEPTAADKARELAHYKNRLPYQQAEAQTLATRVEAAEKAHAANAAALEALKAEAAAIANGVNIIVSKIQELEG